MSKKDFEKRQAKFGEELNKLQKKYGISIYPANAITSNTMEVGPVIKMLDTLKSKEKLYADTVEARDLPDKEA